MESQKDKRRWPRENVEPPKAGILYPKSRRRSSVEDEPSSLVIRVVNMSKKGLLLQTPFTFDIHSPLDMRIWNPHKEMWMAIKGNVTWSHEYPSKTGSYLIGVEFQRERIHEDSPVSARKSGQRKMSPSDLEFLLNTKLFHSIPRESVCPLLNSLTFRRFRAGDRFIQQGDEGDNLFIISRGTCIVLIEKDGTLHPVTRLREGDILGEMAVLTGERRSSHVDAETDIELWSLSRMRFDALCSEYPDLRNILTEIVTDRLSNAKLTAFRTIGKYSIREVIGQGGWSTVYKGVHITLNFPVAIKMLKHTMAMDQDFISKFQNEAKTIARLNHSNIIKVFDIEEMYRTVFIIMEYLNGFSLEYLLDTMPKMSIHETVDILLQVCAGLEYAHQQGIIHQDIKPANIFILPDRTVKIVDFGLACPPGNIDFDLPGTLYYMAPEQIQSEPVDERTDVYSLGITAYEMLIGERPFPEDDLAKLMDMHLSEDAPDPRMIVPDLPDELHTFLITSIRKDPEKRLQNIPAVIELIQPLAEKMGLTCKARQNQKGKMMGLFVFYQEDHQLLLNRLIDTLSSDIADIGALLRIARIEDI